MSTRAETLHITRFGWFEVIWPMLRALLWAGIGFTLAALITEIVTGKPFSSEVGVTIGFFVGLGGWLLGSGAWEAAVKPWFGAANSWNEGAGLARYFRFNTDHKVIGLQYLVFSLFVLFIAGAAAMWMRSNLISPELTAFQTKMLYNEFMSIHGTLMLFAVSVVAIVGGFGNYFVPILVGAEDMTFPKLNGISWWFVPPGVLAIALSPLLGGFQTGWTGYAPLSSTDASGQVLYFLGIFSLGLSSLFSAINVIATTVWMRAKGVTWKNLPMFNWGMLASSFLALVWLPVVGTGMMMGLFDRIIPTAFFNASGQPLLWQDLFWTFGHPEVYIIILAPWALWLEISSVMARKTLFARNWAVIGFVAVALMSSLVWSHHMFTAVSNSRLIPFMSTTELISIPSGLIFMAALGTLWRGRIRLNAPMLLTLFSMFNFLIGGMSGIFLADVPSDLQFQDTYFVVGHFHYTIVGGMIFALLAALFYWFPKMSGRMYNRFWAKFASWWLFAAFNVTFFTMFVSGINGMNRRIAEYLPYLNVENIVTSVAGWAFGFGFFIVLINVWRSWLAGPVAPENPWGGRTLEWHTSSPPPRENFERNGEPALPEVTWDFYEYGNSAGGEEVTAKRGGKS